MNNEEEIQIVRELDFKAFNIALKSNGIVYVLFKDDCLINIELQNKLLHFYRDVTGGKLMPFIFLAAENVSITKEAKENAIFIEDQSMVGASAVVVNNFAYKLIANFYLKINKPRRPYKVFSNEQDAVKWLKTVTLEA
ncbi:MAG: hypothetical protein K0S53_2013 [Bacteroidetes bacterium]|jgi:hypothetical protein|nr:hypothetical protein [Bacteroidota bacterium]